MENVYKFCGRGGTGKIAYRRKQKGERIFILQEKVTRNIDNRGYIGELFTANRVFIPLTDAEFSAPC
jgi:hypothetical protein